MTDNNTMFPAAIAVELFKNVLFDVIITIALFIKPI